MTNLFSIERDQSALTRQIFNKPFSCITCSNESTSNFITNYNEEEPVIIWLDYTDTKWKKQFSECESLIANLKESDILKVTFNANPDVLKNDSGKTLLEVFKSKANHHLLNENLIENDVQTMINFAKTINDFFCTITESILSDEGLFFYPLLQFRYIDDRHQMITITGIILSENSNFPEIFNGYNAHTNWLYSHTEWGDIHEINVPVLTQKEKYAINQLLPLNGKIDISQLPFILDKNKITAEKMIENYIKYYRYIPNFQRAAT